MKFTEKYSKAFQFFLPTPLSIALLLTVLTFVFALVFTENRSSHIHFIELLNYWEGGLWNNGLIVFAFQMMLMLVLGHILALTPPVNKLINLICKYATTSAKAAALITFFTILVSLFNWGLGLIFGAIISRKVGEQALKNKLHLNYPLIGAAGYSGLMVWHGGISGSSLAKVAEPGHLKSLLGGSVNKEQLARLPDKISFDETVFSSLNIIASLAVIILLPTLMFFLGKLSSKKSSLDHLEEKKDSAKKLIPTVAGAEHFDYSVWFTKAVGSILLAFITYKIVIYPDLSSFGFITPNFINLTLLALCFFCHKNILEFLSAGDKAIGGAVGILIQFPLYFGIMGIMKSSGLVNQLSDFFVSISNSTTLPIYTFISAGLVNIFVPSGGGQWAIQGPIIIQASEAMGVPFSKSILALAYGDQLTNMLQPFWALPLLGITKLKAKEILPYTLILMVVGALVYLSVLLLF